MATYCSRCDAEISALAATCPTCGYLYIRHEACRACSGKGHFSPTLQTCSSCNGSGQKALRISYPRER